jgi:hypothetical protein
LEVSVARKQNEYSDWKNFVAMFYGLKKDIGITLALLAIVVPPIFLLLWLCDIIIGSIL